MTIKKYGTEPAKVETRAEDNDAETLESLGKSDRVLRAEALAREVIAKRDGDQPE